MPEIKKDLFDVVIVGGGPAGLTAGIYLARACYRVLIVEKEKFGGQITITSEVVNYPGIDRISGSALTENMRKQAESFGAEFLLAEVTNIDPSSPIKKVTTTKGTFETFGVLLATGAHPRMIGFEGEADFKGHGVAYCATCDGEFFTGKEVFVVGGGFAAAEEAVFLTKYAKHVTVLVREDDFTCAKATAEETKNHPKINVLYNTEVKNVKGDSILRSITYFNNKTKEETTFTPENGDTFGVFVFAGYSPSTELVKDFCEVNEQGYVVTDANKQTTKEGIYAAGDVCIKTLRQVVTSTGDGALAATSLEKYCSEMQKVSGLIPDRDVVRAQAHAVSDTNSDNYVSTSTIFTDDVIAQLNQVFAKMENPLLLKLYLDEKPISQELKKYIEEMVKLTDKLKMQEETDTEGKDTPCVCVCTADGKEVGMAFHGVPGGHEFTSFVLGLYNASGSGQKIDEETKKKIEAIDKDIHMDIMVSLTCTMCPELVTAAEKIASLNDHVSVDVYDLNHYPEMREKYNVMSVPCFLINDSAVHFGKKTIEELLTLF